MFPEGLGLGQTPAWSRVVQRGGRRWRPMQVRGHAGLVWSCAGPRPWCPRLAGAGLVVWDAETAWLVKTWRETSQTPEPESSLC